MHIINIQPGEGALQRAIDSLPADGQPAVIRLEAGEYREKVELRRDNVTLEGAGADVTRIIWADAATATHPDGMNIGTFRSYTLLVLADRCTLRGLTVQNAASPREKVGQCVALFADGDLFTCEDVMLLSAQDTLFTAPLPPKEALKNGFLGPTQFLPRKPQRHVYRRCVIKGDVDFIFGGAAAWFEDCDIVSINAYTDGRVPGGYATAASTPEGQKFGYIFRNCRFLAGEGVGEKTMLLGRPWREFAKTVLIGCEIGPHIRPEGWDNWGKPQFGETGLYAEYGCYGPGSDTSERAAFSRVLTEDEAAEYTYENFMESI